MKFQSSVPPLRHIDITSDKMPFCNEFFIFQGLVPVFYKCLSFALQRNPFLGIISHIRYALVAQLDRALVS